ncbi:hypothetical protein JCM10213_008997 [Rhodosporidiobolus nylandii]
MDAQKVHDCAVCSAKTDKRCSGCGDISPTYFCSLDCQKLIWDTHKYSCGKDPSVFVVPPLSKQELADFSVLQHRAYRGEKTSAAVFENLGSWEEILVTLNSFATSGLALSQQTYITFCAREFLQTALYTQRESAPKDPWQLTLASIGYVIFLYADAIDDLHDTKILEDLVPFRRCNPLLRQLLTCDTLLAKAIQLELKGQPVEFRDKMIASNERLPAAAEACAVDDDVKKALREYAVTTLERFKATSMSKR